jgi:hypothetical protein
MTTFAKKTLTAAVAALSIGAAVAMSAGTAEAKGGRNGAFVGGVVAGLVGGAILGGAAYGGYHHVGYRRYHSDCWTEKRPVFNRWGDFRGYRYIRVCN